jgi:hypothetical protein
VKVWRRLLAGISIVYLEKGGGYCILGDVFGVKFLCKTI